MSDDSETLRQIGLALVIGLGIGWMLWARRPEGGDTGDDTALVNARRERDALAARLKACDAKCTALAERLAETEAAGPDTPSEDTDAGPPPVRPGTLYLDAPPAEVDDLKRISGVGPKMEEVLNEKGIYRFDQLAALTPAEIAWVNEAIGAFPGRIERDDWVEQAAELAKASA